MNKDCEVCGKSVGDVHPSRRFCYECADKREKEWQKAYRERRSGESKDEPRKCRFCGAETDGDLRTRCPACKDEERPPTKYVGKPKVEQKPKPKRKKPLKGCWDLDNKSAVQVDIEASALGLSYGQYISLVGSLFIERYLLSQGITDGLERIDRAWKQFKKDKRERERRIAERIAQVEADERELSEIEMGDFCETSIYTDDTFHSHY